MGTPSPDRRAQLNRLNYFAYARNEVVAMTIKNTRAEHQTGSGSTLKSLGIGIAGFLSGLGPFPFTN